MSSLVDQIMTFIEVVNANGFTRAASKLNISPTAVSKQIKYLEQEIKQNLLYRTTRNLKLTEFGEHFYQQAIKLKNEVEQLKSLAYSKQKIPRGRVRVMCNTFIAKPFLLQHLCQFYHRYPEIELDIDLSERIPDLDRENIDVLVGFSLDKFSMFEERLRQKKIVDTHYLLLAAPSYIKRYGEPKTPEDLQKHHFINHPIRKPNNVIEFANGHKIFFKSPRLTLNSGLTLIDLCCQGTGILQSAHYLSKNKIETGELVVILPQYHLKDVSIYMYYQYLHYEQLHVRAFIDFISEIIPV